MKLSLPLFIASTTLSLVSAGTPFVPARSSSQIVAQHHLNSVLSLRGGEVFEDLLTLQHVEDIIMRASAEGKAVAIDFTATWCGPCQQIAPVYHELSESDAFSNVVFLKVDVDQNPATAAKYDVKAMPTFVFIKRGVVVSTLRGANPEMLKEKLREIA